MTVMNIKLQQLKPLVLTGLLGSAGGAILASDDLNRNQPFFAMHKSKPLSNVIVSCYNSIHARLSAPYTDERNGADVDLALSN